MKRHFMTNKTEQQIFTGKITVTSKGRTIKIDNKGLTGDDADDVLRSESQMVMTLLKAGPRA